MFGSLVYVSEVIHWKQLMPSDWRSASGSRKPLLWPPTPVVYIVTSARIKQIVNQRRERTSDLNGKIADCRLSRRYRFLCFWSVLRCFTDIACGLRARPSSTDLEWPIVLWRTLSLLSYVVSRRSFAATSRHLFDILVSRNVLHYLLCAVDSSFLCWSSARLPTR